MPFRLLGSPREPSPTFTEAQVIWGVPLREGHSDDDDPRAHQGVAQHAFEIGSDERAVCGFEPPKRTHGTYKAPRPQLGLPSGRYNPRCKKCAALVVAVGSEADAVSEPAAAIEARSGEMIGTHVTPTAEVPTEELAEEEPIDAAEPQREPVEPEPAEAETAEAERADDDAADDSEAHADEATATVVERESIEPESWVAEAAPDSDVTSMTEIGWQGSLTVPAGRATVVIEAADAVGAQVVARVVRGPHGIFVESVTVEKGRPTVRLNAPADVPVTVAWLVVPDLGLTEGTTR